MMDIQRRSQLQKIVNDAASTAEERAEAMRQLEEEDLKTQADQDKLIVRYFDREIESEEYCTLPHSTIQLFRALTSWPLGLDLDKMDDYVTIAAALHQRTREDAIRARCQEAIEQTLKLAKRYIQMPKASDAARNATKFLNKLKEQV